MSEINWGDNGNGVFDLNLTKIETDQPLIPEEFNKQGLTGFEGAESMNTLYGQSTSNKQVNHPLLEKLYSRSFDPTEKSEPIRWNIKLRAVDGVVYPVARDNNIILIKGKPGTRKSTFARALVSGVYNNEYSMGFEFQNKGGVIFVDAEQDKATYQACQREFYTLAGWDLSAKRDNYYPYILTPDSIEEKLAMTELAMQVHSDAKYIVIDQLATYCRNYNDTTEAEFLTSKIKTWAFDYEITPIILMHTNFSTDKANGALGSEMEKISNVAFWLQVEGDATKISNTKIRGTKKLNDFWIYHDENGLPMQQDISFGGADW